MEIEKKKFRCHVSIIFEQCARFLAWLILYMGVQLVDLWMELLGKGDARDALDSALGALFIGGVILILVLFSAIIKWRKTTISLEEDAIVWEKNTIHKKTLTISIKNISSINIERNLFERIIGTAKLKIDTASLSTADSTDVLFIFRLEDALKYKNYLETKVRETDGDTARNPADADVTKENLSKERSAQITEILKHCFYDVSVVSVLVGLLFTGLGIFWGVDALRSGNIGTALEELATAAVVIVTMGYTTLKALFGKFFRYYGLTVSRNGNRLHMRYGLLKVKDYVIPVEKINAIYIRQTFIGRLFKQYNASMECVGVGDEENEIAQLTLSLPYAEMVERLSLLLPEYDLTPVGNTKKVGKTALYHKLCRILIFTIVVIGYRFGVNVVSREMGVEIDRLFVQVSAAVIAFIYVWIILAIILQMNTEAVGLYPGYMSASTGNFGRTIEIVPYKKIQYVSINRSPLSRFSGLLSGDIYILAAGFGSAKSIPYITEKEVETLKEKLCGAVAK